VLRKRLADALRKRPASALRKRSESVPKRVSEDEWIFSWNILMTLSFFYQRPDVVLRRKSSPESVLKKVRLSPLGTLSLPLSLFSLSRS
jgi:hypothetical protein